MVGSNRRVTRVARSLFQGLAALGLVLLALLGAGCSSSSSDSTTPATNTALSLQQKLAIESNPLGDGGASDAGPASPSIGSFAVYATEALLMNGGATVTGCSVGVENTTGPFLSGGAAAYFNSGASIQSSQTL